MMEDSDVATTDNCNRKLYMTYRIAPVLMTLRDFEGHPSIYYKPFKMQFSYTAAVDKISTDIAHCAVPVRYVFSSFPYSGFDSMR